MLVKFEQIRMVQTTRILIFLTKKKKKKKKKRFFKNLFCQSVDAIVEDVSVAETMQFNAKIFQTIYHLSVFQKITVVRHV